MHGWKRRVIVLMEIALILVATNACTTYGTSRSGSGPSTHHPTSAATRPAVTPARATAARSHAIKTVFLIMMENHNWSDILESRSAPYLNRLVRGSNNAQTSYATQYYNPPGNHPSLPNYLWLEGGQCYSYCGTDNAPGTRIHAAHLASLLSAAGISWKAYEEGNRDGACPGSNAGEYAVRHDPFVYFQDVGSRRSVCTAHIKSYRDLSTDLANNRVARYNVITPNLCHDMHDSCSPTNNSIKQGDSWLSRQIPMIERSRAYQHGGAIVITWDEGVGGDGPIGMIVLSRDARGHGYHSRLHYTHSSTLRTMEEIYGIRPMLGGAANARDLRDLFSTFP